ncbi:MAG: M3 family oligoendopeptidase [Phycisphaerales bacterium]
MPTATTDFVPPTLDGADWSQIEPLLNALLDRPVNSAPDLERWLLDRSELEAACAETEANLYIDMTCDTESKAKQDAYTRYVEEIPPRLKPLAFELDKKLVALSRRFPLPQDRYTVLLRDTQAEVELFRDQNVPIQTELEKLSQEYQQVVGAMAVQFDGREQTLPMMQRYQESTDRAVRESAWRAVADRRLRDAPRLDELYDQMIERRDRMARNAGFDTFVGYAFKSKKRFDYTPADCRLFHGAVEQAVVPFLRREDARRRRQLRIDPLRPWDLGVDPKGRAPLKPFTGGVDLINRTTHVFTRLDPRLAAMFSSLGDGANSRGAAGGACLDLDSRKGKAPGGYQSMRDRSRKAFIFMNAAGLHRDVETMVHEAGHAFHSMLCVDEPLVAYRHSPIEFAEVASMTMELLTMPYWKGEGSYYATEEDFARAKRKQIEGSVGLLPWIATIDAFQHWVYENPRHTRDQRTAHWLALDDRFGHEVAWQGLEPHRAALWQRQLHLYGAPMYYIEYGIAQLGALGLWLRSLEEGEKTAVEAYMKALSLGGSKPLPDLFSAAGLRFDFGPETIKRLVDRVEKELEKLPE